MMRKIAILLLVACFLVTSCSQATIQTTATIQPTGALIPYHSPTATNVRPTATIIVTIPVAPTSTPTPFMHTLTKDDTMGGLAYRYGIKLEDLKTANPSVNPNAMSVGSQLIIPLNTEVAEEQPTSTAIPVRAGNPVCYRSGDGGAWCVVAIHNDLDTTLENLSVWIGLYSSQGENLTSQEAYAPLNILRPGGTMPLMAYFSAPLPDKFSARSELLTAYTISSDDARYLDVEVKTDKVTINPDAGQAEVSGRLLLPAGSKTASQVWVLVVAYDSLGNILGARKWKSGGETAFDTTVYSLGGAIDRVDVLAEVRP